MDRIETNMLKKKDVVCFQGYLSTDRDNLESSPLPNLTVRFRLVAVQVFSSMLLVCSFGVYSHQSLRAGHAPACLCTIYAMPELLWRLYRNRLAFSISYPLSQHATAALVYSPSQNCLFETLSTAGTHSTTICQARFLYICYQISFHIETFTVSRFQQSYTVAGLNGCLRLHW